MLRGCRCLPGVSNVLQNSKVFAQITQARNVSRSRLRILPPVTYRGIYKTDGEKAETDDLLLCQTSLNYHPGLNVEMVRQGVGDHEILLKAMCPGTVMITREKCDPDWDLAIVDKRYGHRRDTPLYKMTFNVLPFKDDPKFKLIEMI